MKPFHLTDAFLVGHPELDAEHHRIVDLLNECIGIVSDGEASAALQKKVVRLSQALRDHIVHEERVMEEIGYAIAEEEKRHHKEGLEKLAAIVAAHADGHDDEGYVRQLKGLILETFLKTDMGLKAYFPEIAGKV